MIVFIRSYSSFYLKQCCCCQIDSHHSLFMVKSKYLKIQLSFIKLWTSKLFQAKVHFKPSAPSQQQSDFRIWRFWNRQRSSSWSQSLHPRRLKPHLIAAVMTVRPYRCTKRAWHSSVQPNVHSVGRCVFIMQRWSVTIQHAHTDTHTHTATALKQKHKSFFFPFTNTLT